MPAGRLFSLHVVARLRDFFDDRTHWQRRLWNVGLVLSLRELLEAAEERDRALSAAAVSDLAHSVTSHIAVDPGARASLSVLRSRGMSAGTWLSAASRTRASALLSPRSNRTTCAAGQPCFAGARASEPRADRSCDRVPPPRCRPDTGVFGLLPISRRAIGSDRSFPSRAVCCLTFERMRQSRFGACTGSATSYSTAAALRQSPSARRFEPHRHWSARESIGSFTALWSRIWHPSSS